jgi:SAM-dependent methyltransferase
VPNAGDLLTNMRRHLNPGGRLVITTPHPFFFLNPLASIFSWEQKFLHPDHVAWFCPSTLGSLLRKTGYEVETAYYATRSRKLRKLLSFLHMPCYGVLAMTIIIVARPVGPDRT